MKSFRGFAVLLLSISLLGCKPKETSLSGQIFIVTRSAENIKLGAVEVLLIERQQVLNFLENKQPYVESIIHSRKQALSDAEEEVRKAQADFNRFLANGLTPTNSELARAEAQIESARKQINTSQAQFFAIEAQQRAASASGNTPRANALLIQMDKNLEYSNQKIAELETLFAKVNTIVGRAKADETNKLQAAKLHAARAAIKLENSPTAEDYVLDFSSIAMQRTISDADGKFHFAYRHGKSFTIFARGRRSVLNKIEEYYWLVNAPTNVEKGEIFLSNNNVVFIDPDGYFKLKPKQQP